LFQFVKRGNHNDSTKVDDLVKKIVVQTDGGCRDNPGPGAWAFVLLTNENDSVHEHSGFLPHCTNNQAEYRALEAACISLCHLQDIEKVHEINIFSDSQLIVEQINQRWQVRDVDLRPYYLSANTAFNKLCSVCPTTLTWFRREHNTKADALCNRVMDRHGIVCSLKGKRRDD